MPIVKTNTGRRLIKGARHLFVLPYVDGPSGTPELGQDLYDLSAIVGDSIALEQGEGDGTSKENEFTNEPLVKNVYSGEWTFSAQCLDLQNAVLRALFSAYTHDSSGAAALRPDYETLYALVMVRFAGENVPDMWLPKVLLNSSMQVRETKSRGSQGAVSGTLFPCRCGVSLSSTEDGGEVSHALAPFSDAVSGGVEHTPRTPVLFAPKGSRVFVMRGRDADAGETVYDSPNPSVTGNQDCCARGFVVYDSDPATARK